mmetsp:Transcript_27808/g.24604  ORF Transcript_27808/g.24604 Transcript_27808/m.24604 type:complete len:95 (-) Transcript_27808:108-392(-)
MGILALQIIWFITVWRHLGPLKYIYAIYLTIITGSMLFGGFYEKGSDVDSWGHIGGFISGLCFTLIFFENAKTHEILRKFRMIAAFALVLIIGC